ncbi:protein-disulfide isomerase [Dyadobacter sp. BE34]|uniref:Protein-disulfide isomerase n=1 Tax=Dyadobacter fermentans TaxID=94254 RepID=A0ABU1R718_9BACT|nr:MULTISPECIES: thioredoxin domain-containing protein [Dyadobacter]MDR6809204.1 protein-disulfide isomerase [Dyadobacter fermentans]MDR7046947.1 protein-disulfide isomerase [Dyadobacter sp. BE242]MDR7201261.1 protein-disulfide isomerase [Dyadobacter sp. BE34]MDR7219221.1 protein-disulfide isomerase [Dyadobacter sp. BE31]MDR7264569.1 protein-disulfide isomerase [Dyadobacter sp. BE32]
MYKYLIMILVFCFSCESTQRKQPAASYKDGEISLEEVDNFIKDEVYEQLYAIYYLRNVSLDEVIANRLFTVEAEKRKISVDELIRSEVDDKLSPNGLAEYKKRMHIDSTMRDTKNSFRSVSVKTEDGKRELWDRYKRYERGEFGKRLMEKYEVKKLLVPPVPPKSNLDSIRYISTGNKTSPTSFWIFSDFDCPSCKAVEPVLKTVYEKYKEKLEFKYTALTDDFRFATIACECADKQGQFMQLYNHIFESGKSDSTSIAAFMNDKMANYSLFTKCTTNEKMKAGLVDNLNILKERKILSTPSIYIDNRLYHGQITEEQLSIYIDNILQRKSEN